MLRRILFMADAPPGGNGNPPHPAGGTPPGGTPPPAGTPPAKSGEDTLIDDLIGDVTKADGGTPPPAGGTPPPPAGTPPPAGAKTPPPPAPKPGEKPPTGAKTPPAAKTPPEPVLDWKTAPAQFKAAHEKLKSEYEATKAELTGKLQTTESQMRELQGRKFLTPEDEARYTQLETRQQQIEAELYAQNYQASPEFKEKFETPANKIFALVTKELKGMQIKYKDGEEEKTRAATMADFQAIQSLGDSLSEQRKKAKELFGEDADIILGHARRLADITEEANAAIEKKRTGWADDQKKLAERNQATMETSRRVYHDTDRALVEKYPQYFAEDPANPEFNAALKEGLEYVDSNSVKFDEKSPEQKAHTSAIVRRWAASWPANQILIKQLRAKLAEKDTELAALRASDPGNPPGGGGAGGGGGGGEEGAKGSDSLAEDIEKMQSQT